MRVLILCFVSLIFASGLKTVTADDLLQSEKEIIAWLDELGYQDFSETPLVNVATGNWSRSAGEPQQTTFSLGFLIAENGRDFTVVGLNGIQNTYTTKQEGVAPHEAVHFEKVDLKKVIRERIKLRHTPTDPWGVVGHMKSEAFENVLLARTCAKQGHDKEARELFELAGLQIGQGRNGKILSLIDFLKQDQAHTRMERAVLAFGNPKITRPELLAMFEDIVKHFPKSIHLNRARATADLLKKMIKEDEDHLAKKIPPLSELTGEALISELIFQLRTQNGNRPGVLSIFTDEREADCPAARLVSIGFDAVPQLIEAIGDQRFTRSVSHNSDFYFSHETLRVGDCAAMVISRIAGRRFFPQTFTEGTMTKDDAKSTKNQVEAWWKQIQTKGEEIVLVEAVKAGDQNSEIQAMVLLKKYPDLAFDAIREGLAKPEHPSIGERLLKLLVDDGSDEALEIVRNQLIDGSQLSIRVSAATALAHSGQPKFALERMLHEWSNLSTSKEREQSGYDPRSRLAVFLLQSGSATAVEGLFKQFAKLPTNTKYGVISSLSYRKLQREPAYSKTVEAFLVDCLHITEEVNRVGFATYGNRGFGDQSFSNARICDFAGYVLTQNWPDSYACGLDGTERDRDTNRFAAINHWRQANGMKPIKAP